MQNSKILKSKQYALCIFDTNQNSDLLLVNEKTKYYTHI